MTLDLEVKEASERSLWGGSRRIQGCEVAGLVSVVQHFCRLCWEGFGERERERDSRCKM